MKRSERGFVLAWVAVLMPFLFAFVALAIDFGRAHMIAASFQAALDAAAWAAVNPDVGTGEVVVRPQPVPPGQRPAFHVELRQDLAHARALAVYEANRPVAGIKQVVQPLRVRLLSPDSVEVRAAVEVQTFFIGPLLLRFDMGALVIERFSVARSLAF